MSVGATNQIVRSGRAATLEVIVFQLAQRPDSRTDRLPIASDLSESLDRARYHPFRWRPVVEVFLWNEIASQ